ncbi:MAG: sarcosine oxidase subunit gamma [Pseudomonadota bacterium]
MGELKAKTPCDGMLPLAIGEARATETELGPLTLITSFGDTGDLSQRLEQTHGIGWPNPNRSLGKEDARCVWFGRRAALLIGTPLTASLSEYAAIVDQTDAWAAVTLEGEDAEAVLARLTPVEIRAAHFKRGHTMRTQIMHMNASITRVGSTRFLILVFRSMAQTLLHDLKQAMAAVAMRR